MLLGRISHTWQSHTFKEQWAYGSHLGMCETMPWVPDSGGVMQREFAWSPCPGSHPVLTSQRL